MPSKHERLSASRVDDALRRQRRAKERFLAAPPVGTARAPGTSSADWHRRASSASPTRWRVSRDAQAPRLSPGDRLAVVAPASSFRRDEFDRGHRRDQAPRVRPGVRRLRLCEARRVSWPAPADVRAARHHPGLAGPVYRRAHRRSRRIRERADAAASRSRRVRAARRKPFIGYSDVTSVLTFLTMNAAWWRFTARCSTAVSVGRSATTSRRSEGARNSAEPLGELAPRGARGDPEG